MYYMYALADGAGEKIKKLGNIVNTKLYDIFKGGAISSEDFAKASKMPGKSAYKFCEMSADMKILNKIANTDEETARQKILDEETRTLKDYMEKTIHYEDVGFKKLRSKKISEETGISMYMIPYRMKTLVDENFVIRGTDHSSFFIYNTFRDVVPIEFVIDDTIKY